MTVRVGSQEGPWGRERRRGRRSGRGEPPVCVRADATASREARRCGTILGPSSEVTMRLLIMAAVLLFGFSSVSAAETVTYVLETPGVV